MFNILFIGASKFGLNCLNTISELENIHISGVISNNETFSISYNKSGVKNVLYADFESFSAQNNIPFYRMKSSMQEKELYEFITLCKPNLIVVVGWYHLIPKSLLNEFKFCGLHASLLPDYSGGAPLVWAIINGETETGLTFFMFDEGVDSGDIIGQEKTEITPDDTIKTLYDKIELLGFKLLEKYLPKFADGSVVMIEQDETKRRVFPQRKPEDGLIDWTWDNKRIKDFIRAQTKPYPGAFTYIEGKKVMIWDADII